MAISFQSAQQSAASGETSVATANIDITAGTNYLVIYGGGKKAPTGATFNAVSGTTVLDVANADSDAFVGLYYILKSSLPSATTTLAVTVTFASTSAVTDRFAGVLAFAGAAQEAPEATGNTSSTAASTAAQTFSITTLTNGAMIVDVAVAASTTLVAASTTTGQENPLMGDVTALIRVGASYKAVPTAGTTDMSWTQTANLVKFAYGALAIKPFKSSSMSDNFDDNSLDAKKWVDWGGAQTVETNQEFEITGTTTAAYYGVDSADRVDMTGDSVLVQLVNIGSSTIASWEVYPLNCAIDANNQLFWGYFAADNTVKAYKKVATVSTSVYSATYDSAVHKWFRIRESAGTTYWDTSVDGTTWTNRANEANPIAVIDFVVDMLAGTWAAEVATATAKFDNYNNPPAAASTVVKDIIGSGVIPFAR
jgi:hypothetical protein